MKVFKHNLGDFEEIEILTLADWHLGDPHSDIKQIYAWLDYVKSKPNVFVILNGDLMDCATRHSIGDCYSATLSPMEQLKQCAALFGDIKDRILFVDGGNHEERIYRTDGLDVSAMLCAQLGLECYAADGAILFVRVGKQTKHKHRERPVCYTVFVQHGAGGGRKEGGKIQRLSDLAAICDCDTYIHSHTHLPAIFKQAYIRVDTSNSTIATVTKLFVNTSSALDYGGYGQRLGFKPAAKDTPIITLCGTHKEMSATL